MDNVIQCKKGWKSVYTPILEEIFNHDDKAKTIDYKIGVKSIKRIDGSMQINLINPSLASQSLINKIQEASKKSLNVCEFCGKEKEVGTTMNIELVTCCKSCWEKEILTKHKTSIWKNLTTNKLYKRNERY